MTTAAERKLDVGIVYNGIPKSLKVELQELVSTVLQRAIAEFHIAQNPHLLSLYRQDGSVVPENESVERAGLKPCEVLLLRPNAVKGGNEPLQLTSSVLNETFRILRLCGRGECECVAYWIGPSDFSSINSVEHPVHRRSAFGYEIDDTWLTNFWKHLATSRQSVKAQVHTHPREAFHSASDDNWPIVSQAGFLSIVIPDFATGETSLANAWIGELSHDGSWHRLAAAPEAICLA